jgi:hypothetical protein
MVEAIRYTQAPLYNEKSHVVAIVVDELLQSIGQKTDNNSISSQLVLYRTTIQDFLDDKIDYHIALQQLQPLQYIANIYEDNHIAAYNAIVSIINALNHQVNHTVLLRKLCQRLQNLTQVQSEMEEPVVEYL